MNQLALKAGGDVLMLANDDLVLDSDCIDSGIAALMQNGSVGLVGARLRDQHGLLTHAGINFDSKFSSYHSLDGLINSNETVLTPSGPVPAVSGALQWIHRTTFLEQPFNTAYRVCGEDVELCLDIQQHLKQDIWLCNEASAIHEAESTRSSQQDQGQNSEDLLRLRARVRTFIEQATADQLKVLLLQQQRESQQLRDLLKTKAEIPELNDFKSLIKNFGSISNLKEELDNFAEIDREQNLVLSDLREERIRLQEQLEILRGAQS